MTWSVLWVPFFSFMSFTRTKKFRPISKPLIFLSCKTVLDSNFFELCCLKLSHLENVWWYHWGQKSLEWQPGSASSVMQDWKGCSMDEISIKTPNLKCCLYWCFLELIDWRYSQSCWYFRLLLWTNAPLTFSLVAPPPLPCVNKYRGMYLYNV